MNRLRLPLWLIAALLVTWGRAAADAPPEGDDFFEKKIRPVLVDQCYRCHSQKVKGGLRLDSREGLLKGGDSGPAVVPGDPERSRLVEAIRYKNTELLMPPKGRLADPVIADFTRWVRSGVPWPKGAAGAATVAKGDFDLEARKRSHWAWGPVRPAAPPAVKNAGWVRDPVDAFVLAKIEAMGLEPAAPADRRTWLRRAHFALVGLPPTPEVIDAFLADTSSNAAGRVVDRLLASPSFGERWARHWLDLVRYAETRGHEFDPLIPNAHQYRDYVIRALNADVPYDQFVREHLAGDLLTNPRRDPSTGFDESVLGTGFWFLGEEVHSPVDVRADQADRFDNRIDVMTKTFLGLTVACARCHDHKFDAITAKDYYSLFGFLSSSTYRQVRFDSLDRNRAVARALGGVRSRARDDISRALGAAARPATGRMGDYLLAARTATLAGPEPTGEKAGDIVFADFENGSYEGWVTTGTAFGSRPQSLETIAPYQGKINGVGKFFVNSHNVRNGEDVAAGDAHKGTLTSRPFKVERDYVTLLVGGGADDRRTCVRLMLADGTVVRTAAGRNDNTMYPVRWDVRPYRGKLALLQAVDDAAGSWGNVGFDQVVLTNRPDKGDPAARPLLPSEFGPEYRRRLRDLAESRDLDPTMLAEWVAALLRAGRDPNDPLYPWAKLCESSDAAIGPLAKELRRRADAAGDALKGASVVVDYDRSGPGEWLQDEAAFGPGPTRTGEVRVTGSTTEPGVRFVRRGAAEYDRAFDRLKVAPGSENDPGALGRMPLRAGRTLMTPTFKVANGKVHYLIKGAGAAYAAVSAHGVIEGPLHGELVLKFADSGEFRWYTQDLTRYQGLDAHVEFTAQPGSDFAVAVAAQGDHVPGSLDGPNPGVLTLLEGARSPEGLAAGYGRLFAGVAERLAAVRSEDADAGLADWLIGHRALLGPESAALNEAMRHAFADHRQATDHIRAESRLAPGILDVSGIDERVFIRGSPKAEGEPAPRRLLTALVGEKPLKISRGSGRLELARQVTDPAVNPFVARVLVNRVWHHLFGRGLVGSVDNFGVLGEAPTHPELLDYLADRFVREGWSLKTLVRELTLSNAYAMSSGPTAADAADPDNLLLHRMRLRRLEGETIRDAMLAVSGRLDPTLYGRSVNIHLTPFLDGRGREGRASGPVDGDGRRSVYLGVRRNFLSPFLLAFDTPSPFSTMGRRSVSNVPAQALILMNDPFVHEQAVIWARKVLARPGDGGTRVDGMYRGAFGRPPTASERAACAAFLADQARERNVGPDDSGPWSDLAHTLFNVKDFVFVE